MWCIHTVTSVKRRDPDRVRSEERRQPPSTAYGQLWAMLPRRQQEPTFQLSCALIMPDNGLSPASRTIVTHATFGVTTGNAADLVALLAA